MPYSSHFTSRFSQSPIIDAAIAQADRNANLQSVRDGVCQTISLIWLMWDGWTDDGFKKLTQEDVTTPSGGAFWKQVLGAQRDIDNVADPGTRASRLTDNFRALSKTTKTLALDISQALAADMARNLLAKRDYTCYLRFVLAGGGHGCGVRVINGSSWVFFDPNGGNCVDLIGTGPGLAAVLADANTAYTIQRFEAYRLT
jgi:hypothetical protein